jgi:hypothetical protein
MAKLTCAGGCGKVRDLEVSQKGAKDVSFTVSPKHWMCADCTARQVPPTAVESRPHPLPQSVDPGVAFTFMPREDKPARKAPAAEPAKAPEGAKSPEAEGAKA